MTTISDETQALIDSEDIVQCSACDELSAYAWQHVTEKAQHFRLGYEKGEIAHVGAACCFDWECGHCGATNVEPDSPTLAEVYTHVAPEFGSHA